MDVTISIGIGINGANYVQNYEYSRIAIDLALVSFIVGLFLFAVLPMALKKRG